MSLLLPQNPELRALVDVESLARKEWATFREAKTSAAKMFEGQTDLVNRVFCQAIRANGDIHLLAFGPRGGVKVLWNFGNPLTAS